MRAPSLLPPGFSRLVVIGLLVALVFAGIALAVHAVAIDREVHRRYDSALTLMKVVVDSGRVAAAVRAGPAPARGQGVAPEPSTGHAGATAALEETLLARLAALDAGTLTTEERAAVDELRATLQRTALLQRRLLAGVAGEARGGAPTAARLELEREAQRLEQVSARLAVMADDRTDHASHGAAAFLGLARAAVIGFAILVAALAIVLAVLALRTLRANRELLQRLQQIARQDPLTGVVNRRGLDDGLPLELIRAGRTADSLSVVMIDLDHFKRYNDRRGHAAGDALLRSAAQGWLKHLRATDLLARYGGEEFTLVLPGCDSEQAALLVARLRQAVPDHQTFSAGIALWDGAESAAELLQRADVALSQAKKGGRNRSMIAGREPQATLPLRAA